MWCLSVILYIKTFFYTFYIYFLRRILYQLKKNFGCLFLLYFYPFCHYYFNFSLKISKILYQNMSPYVFMNRSKYIVYFIQT